MAGNGALALDVGFTDPVHESRAWFRELMEAMARPGSLRRGTATPRAVPPPLDPVAGALLLTLADVDTPLWLAPSLRERSEAGTWLRFHTGAAVLDEPARATFAALRGRADGAAFERVAESLARGEEAYPDRSATLFLEVAALDTDPRAPGETLTLEGPGIATCATLVVDGLPPDFVAWRARNRARFPLGVDVVLVAADVFAALPRTTRVARAAAAA